MAVLRILLLLLCLNVFKTADASVGKLISQAAKTIVKATKNIKVQKAPSPLPKPQKAPSPLPKPQKAPSPGPKQKYTEKNAAKDTGVSLKEVSKAWHQARVDAQRAGELPERAARKAAQKAAKKGEF